MKELRVKGAASAKKDGVRSGRITKNDTKPKKKAHQARKKDKAFSSGKLFDGGKLLDGGGLFTGGNKGDDNEVGEQFDRDVQHALAKERTSGRTAGAVKSDGTMEVESV
jgi:hypothetical protein